MKPEIAGSSPARAILFNCLSTCVAIRQAITACLTLFVYSQTLDRNKIRPQQAPEPHPLNVILCVTQSCDRTRRL